MDEPGEYEQGPLLTMGGYIPPMPVKPGPEEHIVKINPHTVITPEEARAYGKRILDEINKPGRGLSPGTSAYWKRSPFDGRPN